jgi:phospholipase C
MEIVNLLQHQPQFFGDFEQFLDDCEAGSLPDYSFIEPNYSDHDSDSGTMLPASDQHPDHDVREGERFIASVYMAIRSRPAIWSSTALLVVYDEHGGIYDHVPPPACIPDDFVAQPADTKTGKEFKFDRLGVRVPAVLISPWIPRATVVPGAGVAGGRCFEHASIPATVTDHYDDYRFRAPHLIALQGTIEYSLWGPVGAFAAIEGGKVASTRDDLSFSGLRASGSVGVTLRAGGFPLVNLSWSFGGEGHHVIGEMSSTLLGGSSRPSLF